MPRAIRVARAAATVRVEREAEFSWALMIISSS
jgi:hypothetical protein